MEDGAISPYDDIFKRKAKEFNLDWRMLAGIAFIESRFNHAVVSHKGPIGLMQLMPQTARIFGHEPEDVLDPDLNIELACRLYLRIADRIRNRVPGISDEDLMCVSLAGYNAGIGHVYDAIRLAETLGYKANVWPNNVEHCLRLKSDPQYYRMSVVKQGKFNGAFTINYVNQVMAAYHTFCQKVPKD
jgi:membrane-bound lytic murein transglycosylase F